MFIVVWQLIFGIGRATICCITGPDVGFLCEVLIPLEYAEDLDETMDGPFLDFPEHTVVVHAETWLGTDEDGDQK